MNKKSKENTSLFKSIKIKGVGVFSGRQVIYIKPPIRFTLAQISRAMDRSDQSKSVMVEEKKIFIEFNDQIQDRTYPLKCKIYIFKPYETVDRVFYAL